MSLNPEAKGFGFRVLVYSIFRYRYFRPQVYATSLRVKRAASDLQSGL